MPAGKPYYRPDLALIHDAGFGRHADRCAPGILKLLAPIRETGGVVLELGCGSGLLTRHLTAAGHRVIATDASPAMLDLARTAVPDAAEIRPLTLPDDPLPHADAIVSVGHVLSYLPDESAIQRAFRGIAAALNPGGVLALDICDLEWGRLRVDQPDQVLVNDDWTLITRFAVPRPDQYVREMTTFVREPDNRWRRDDEQHDNVLIDTTQIPPLLHRYGVEARLGDSFDDEPLLGGLVTVIGQRRLR